MALGHLVYQLPTLAHLEIGGGRAVATRWLCSSPKMITPCFGMALERANTAVATLVQQDGEDGPLSFSHYRK